ncbi:MAG TPA: mechanosensitive ion channel protein, partial [Rhodoferax sp.]|nr:mechanosensitive ion channel protein [Rhodoferax sp.]
MGTPLRSPAPQPIDDLQAWLAAFTQASVLVELLVLGACVALAWGLVGLARKALGSYDERSILFGKRAVDGVLFPVVLLCLGYLARALVAHWVTVAVFKVVIPVLVALVVIRIGVKVLRVAFEEARWARSLEHTISW